jgi:hypothetical protein
MSILERAGEWILHVLQPAERDRVGAVELKHAVFGVEVVAAAGRAAAGAAVAVGGALVGGDGGSSTTTRALSGALCTVVRLGRGRLDRSDHQAV